MILQSAGNNYSTELMLLLTAINTPPPLSPVSQSFKVVVLRKNTPGQQIWGFIN